MLDKNTFARGLQLINAVLSKNAQIETNDSIDSYYFLLKDLPAEYFLNGISNLMRSWKNPHFIPGPGEIREAVEKEMFGGLSKEEFKLIMKTYELTKKPISNLKIQNLIENKEINQFLLEK